MTTINKFSNQLFNLSPMDPPTVMFATFFLAGVGALAGFVAARRAMLVNPIVALRCE